MTFKPGPAAVRSQGIIQNAKAIKNCLDYLAVEAKQSNLIFASHLIGVAAEALQESINVNEHAQEEVKARRSNGSDNGRNGRGGHFG